MDRDNRWDRVERAYNMLTCKKADYRVDSALEGLNTAYNRDENDEFVSPTLIGEAVAIEDGDAIVFMNFRADRAREITRAFVEDQFSGFERKQHPALVDFVMLTSYADNIDTPVAYPPLQLSNVLGEYLQDQNLKQLRIAESFFFTFSIASNKAGFF